MDILLTDEEMRELHRLPDEYGKVYAVAAAQLRKVEPLLRWAYKEGYEDSAHKREADDTIFAKKVEDALEPEARKQFVEGITRHMI